MNTPGSESARPKVMAVAAGVALVVVMAAAVMGAVRADRGRVRAERERTEFDFLVSWAELVDGFESEYLAESLGRLGLVAPDDVAAAAGFREATETSTLASFDRIAATEHNIGGVAGFMAENLREVQADGGSRADYYDAATAELWSIDRWGLAQEPDALLDVYVAYQLPVVIETDRVLGLAALRWDQLPLDSQQWFAAAPASVASGFDSWISEPSEPFAEFVDLRVRLEPTLPGVFDQLLMMTENESFALLEASDSWIGNWSQHSGADPPMAMEQLLAASATVRSDVLGLATDTAMQRSDSAATTASTLRRRFWSYVALTVFAAGSLLAIGAAAYLRVDRNARRWRRDAGTDSLTGLANSRVLDSRANELLADTGSGSDALVLVDLDRFKTVNDTHGHLAGDALLRVVAERLTNEVEKWNGQHGRDVGDTLLTRLGGDEFVIVIHDLDDLAMATDLAERLRVSVASPMMANDRPIQTSLSAGVAFGTGGSTLLDLRTEADIALSQAKRRGRNQVRVFDDPVVRSIVQTVNVGNAEPHIDAHLQAIYDFDGGHDYEALARWIPIVGEPVPAGRWWFPVQHAGESRMLLEAMIKRVATVFHEHRGFEGRVWINVGPHDVSSKGNAAHILTALTDAGIDPERIGIEILETAPILELVATVKNLRELRSEGVHIALDDFGAGYTPLGHLVRLPIDAVKIDRSVITGIDENREHAALIAAVVQAADSLALEVVAEGVERPAEVSALKNLGLRRIQGYLIHRPCKLSDLPPSFDFTTTDPARASEHLSRRAGAE